MFFAQCKSLQHNSKPYKVTWIVNGLQKPLTKQVNVCFFLVITIVDQDVQWKCSVLISLDKPADGFQRCQVEVLEFHCEKNNIAML